MKKPILYFVSGLLAALTTFSLPSIAEAIGGGGQMTDDEIMDAVQRVDGAASQLDADFLDAISSAGFCQITGGADCTMTGSVRLNEDTTCSAPQVSGDVRTTSGIAIQNSGAEVLLCRSGTLEMTIGNDVTVHTRILPDVDDARTWGDAAQRPRRIVSRYYNSPAPAALNLGSGGTSTTTPSASTVTVIATGANAWTPGVTSIVDGDRFVVCTEDTADTITITEGSTYKGTCTLTANTQSCASAVAIAGVWNQVSCSAN